MRFFADENFPRSTIEALQRIGMEITRASRVMPGADDKEVLAHCAQNGLTLLTLDRDFGELVFRDRDSGRSGVILFRLDGATASEFTERALEGISARTDWSGHFSVISRDRIRMTPVP